LFARDHVLITEASQMTIDLEEKHKAGCDRLLTGGSPWLGDERRKLPRTEVEDAAYISSVGASTRCQVINISAEGAAIDVPHAGFVPDRFQLMTEKDRMILNCRVIWIQQNRIGVVFEK
jgi:hypothetical protein